MGEGKNIIGFDDTTVLGLALSISHDSISVRKDEALKALVLQEVERPAGRCALC